MTQNRSAPAPTEIEQAIGEIDSLINEQPEALESISVRADFDNLRAAIARRSIEMAEAIAENPELFEVVRKISQGFFTFARARGLRSEEVSVAGGFMTPDGRIVITLSRA